MTALKLKMPKLKFRIGTKLAISSGLGVLLVAGTIVNQLLTEASVAQQNENANRQQSLVLHSMAAENSSRRLQINARDIRYSHTAEELSKSATLLVENTKHGISELDEALKLSKRPENRERLQKIQQQTDQYSAAAGEIAKMQAQAIETIDKRNAIAANWSKSHEALMKILWRLNPADRNEIEMDLIEANSSFNATRAASWRFEYRGEKEQVEIAKRTSEKTAELLKHAYVIALANEKEAADAVNHLRTIATEYQSLQQTASKLAEQIDDLYRNRMPPIVNEINALLENIVQLAKSSNEEAKASAAAAIIDAGRIAVALGAMVMIVLIGSAFFGAISIARPIRKIADVLTELGSGNKQVEVPFLGRGDEVGNAANAANTFKENLLRIEKMEAEQKQSEIRIAAQRKTEMHKLADEFQSAVGEIVDTVSSASTQLASAANSLNKTADTTQQLSMMVADASEEASANVQSVAS
ncbi:MAG TPA: HAMP domain-containing protein, partial [Xanthobacteraceae bacterium]|nr:HAMP domain-containing protein [Xanthobacteraceae bacterium]